MRPSGPGRQIFSTAYGADAPRSHGLAGRWTGGLTSSREPRLKTAATRAAAAAVSGRRPGWRAPPSCHAAVKPSIDLLQQAHCVPGSSCRQQRGSTAACCVRAGMFGTATIFPPCGHWRRSCVLQGWDTMWRIARRLRRTHTREDRARHAPSGRRGLLFRSAHAIAS